jgi:hypothetical protein
MAQNNDSPGKRLKREEAKNVNFGFMRPSLSPLNKEQLMQVARRQMDAEQTGMNTPIVFGQKPGSIGEKIGQVLTLGETPFPGQGYSLTPSETAKQTAINLAAGEAIGVAAKTPIARKIGKNIHDYYLKKAPWAYKGQEGMMYRGIGREGMEDALESGVFRSKQNVIPIMAKGLNGEPLPFQLNKSFGVNPYFSPNFNAAKSYGAEFIAEVPRAAANWRRRYGSKDWSQIADRPIPITEGRILQKDFWRGYKPTK